MRTRARRRIRRLVDYGFETQAKLGSSVTAGLARAAVAGRFVPARTHARDTVAPPRISRLSTLALVAGAAVLAAYSLSRSALVASLPRASTRGRSRLPPLLLASRPRDHAPPISVRRCGSRLLEDNPAEAPGPTLRSGPSGVFVADRRDSAHAGGGWSRAGDKEGAVKWLPSVP